MRATLGADTVDSPLVSDPTDTSIVVDLVLGEGTYVGRSEWERVEAKVADWRDATAPADIPASRLEWLALRADVFPLHLAAYVQAHRLAAGHTIKPRSCYAFLRAGLPTDLLGLVRAGASAWASALRDAWGRQILPLPGDGSSSALEAELDTELAAMRELVVDAAVAEARSGINQRSLFDLGAFTEAEQREFHGLWLDNAGGDLDAFWSAVAGSTLLGTKLAALRLTVEASVVAGAHVPTVEALLGASLSSIADTAAWGLDDWNDLLTTAEVEPPASITGSTLAARRQKYARALLNIVEDLHPTVALRHAIARDAGGASPTAHTAHLVTFFTNNEAFDIVSGTIGTYVASVTEPWKDIAGEHHVQARRNLEAVQRVYRLTPRIGRYASAKVLLDQGITSAAAVVASTREEFVERFGTLLSDADHHAEALAGKIWDNAAKIHAATLGLASKLALAKSSADFVPVPMPGSKVFEDAEGGLAELADILGNLDYCACTHCRSVFSPAAYLADLLAFLDERPAKLLDDALAVLRARRPDIEHILLDCANTNTVLPHIDLVNELLEAYVASVGGSLPASSHQTTWTSAELRMHPEHQDDAVYGAEEGRLRTSVFPWTLPFSLPTLEARTHLLKLGVERSELMRVFMPESPGEELENQLLDARAGERLGLDAEGFAIVAGLHAVSAPDAREYWGYAAGAATNDWAIELATDVAAVLSKARISLDELGSLLAHRFINPSGSIELQWDESCDLDQASIEFLDAGALDRLHRFLRLQRASGIPARMLDVLLGDALGGTLDRAKLRSLADIVQLRARLELGFDELACFWSDVIDARPYAESPRALYDRRFRPKHAPHLPDFDVDNDQLFGAVPATDILDTHRPRILAGLGIGEADLARLIDSSLATSAFSMANLSALLRSVLLAKALRLSITELVRIVELRGAPFASPAATLAFVDDVALIRASGLTSAQLDALLRHEGESLLDQAASARALAALNRSLVEIDREAERLVDPDGTALVTNVALVLASPHDATAIAIVDKTTSLLAPDQEAFIDTHFAAFVDPALAKQVLVDTGAPAYRSEVADRRAWLLGKVVAHLRRRAKVIETIAAEHELAATVAEALLVDVLHDPAAATIPLLSVYLRPFADPELAQLDPEVHASAFAAWLRVRKAALVCRAFDLRADEVRWYSGRGDWLDLDALPLADADPDAAFTAFARLAHALSLREHFRSGELAHAAIAAASTLDAGLAIFADHAGWDAGALQALAAALGYASAAVLADEQALVRVRDAYVLADRLGVAPTMLFAWATQVPDAVQAEAIVSATRAKVGEDGWPELVTPLRDRIRAKQRDALVDAALNLGGFADADELFAHLLIDVEMAPCMLTSRIKAAITSVQIFVHRVLLHLEHTQVVFKREAIERWEWMKNYRVWEANRKVFLYPENWVEPGLRDDKTPEFERLEADLVQGVLDAPRVKGALGGYLEKLARVANLEVMGVYGAPTPKAELWLLGRTQAKPHTWYVRSRRTSGAWTPWEEVPYAIDSDVVALVVRERRVHIYWLMTHDVVQSDEELAIRYQIGHIERGNDGWADVQLSEQSSARTSPIVENYRLQCWVLEGETRIVVMQSWGSAIRLNVAFSHDPTARAITYLGATFGESSHVHAVDLGAFGDGALLSSPALIARQHGWLTSGPKHVKTRYNEGDDFDPLVEPEQADRWAASTDFMQGDLHGELFQRAPVGGYRALVHQAVSWSPEQGSEWRAVVYDDRARKILLEPYPVYRKASDPKAIKPARAEVFHDCPPARKAAVIGTKAPTAAPQRARDGIAPRRAWNGQVPGQQPQLAAFEGAPTLQVQSLGADLVLAQAKSGMQAANDLGDFASGYPAEPDDFWLGLEFLHHPFARFMLEAVTRDGHHGLYAPSSASPLFRQFAQVDPFVEDDLDLAPGIARNRPKEEFDFRFDSPYGIYNWEIFYHVPMLIADKLATEQRWDEAQQWYHLVFNPIELVAGDEGASKYWRIKPFVEQAGTLAKDQIEAMLGIGVTASEQQAAIDAFERQVAVWERNPFDPHAVARVRPGVYQRTLLRKYFDNLIAWADHLFRRDTIESISEATVLYVLLRQLLGVRPHEVPAPNGDVAKTFADLRSEGLDAFSNAAIALESWIHLPSVMVEKVGCAPDLGNEAWVRVPVVSHFWYFCYPPNPELLKYWDIVEDRLFKIRHCQNIEGVTRSLALFEPPIDPALLVQAAAAGVDLQSLLAELDSGLPPYRFRGVIARASGFAGSLRGLAGALLSALEKQDGEQLARIRSEQELEMLSLAREIRTRQIGEAREAIESLTISRRSAEDRRDHYQGLIDTDVNQAEKTAMLLSLGSQAIRASAGGTMAVGSILRAIPQFHAGLCPGIETGGAAIGGAVSGVGEVIGTGATILDAAAAWISTNASYARRMQDWELQRDQATHELQRIERDLAAARIRLEIAERELQNHDRQTEHSRAVDLYMRSKFTNRELYDWMLAQLSTLYFQTYQLAFDLAKRAERAYRHELAIPSSEPPIIKYGYWDSLRRGLLAGDKLAHDLERLDLAYMDRDIREFELRKTISLAELDPEQLERLRETGTCTFDIPEVLYDLDHPGQYLRRIRAVRLTIPAVVGPYTSLGARLQLESHRTRTNNLVTGGYAETENDSRFTWGSGAGQAIATSTAMADGGLFNLDFRDERYLPFEYCGAISRWTLTLPSALRQFDYRTIEDVLVHIDYTARDGISRDIVEDSLVERLNELHGEDEPLALLVSAHEAFPNAWEHFFAVEAGNHVLELPMQARHFPYFAQRRGFKYTKVGVVLMLAPELEATTITLNNATLDVQVAPSNFTKDGALMTATFTPAAPDEVGTWTLTIADADIPEALQDAEGALDPTKVIGMTLVIPYALNTP